MKVLSILTILLLPNLVFGGDIVRTQNGLNYRGAQLQLRANPYGGVYLYQNGRYNGQVIGHNFIPSVNGTHYYAPNVPKNPHLYQRPNQQYYPGQRGYFIPPKYAGQR